MGRSGPNFPQDKKEKILHRMSLKNFNLFCATKKSPEAARRSSKAWEELFHYCQEIEAPHVQCVQDVKNLFESWKNSLNQKKKRKNSTGAGRQRDYYESDKILENLLNENPFHLKKTVGTAHGNVYLGQKKSKEIYLYRTKGTYCGYMGNSKIIKFQHSFRR